jgi:hypothetical protein
MGQPMLDHHAKRAIRTVELRKNLFLLPAVTDATVPSSRSLYCTLRCQGLNEIEAGPARPQREMARKSTESHEKGKVRLLLQNLDTTCFFVPFRAFRGS